ncbi:Rhodanese-like protein [Gloeophyllum trabeum ATCC 11539]|uniref:Rhodanese-like protein n=1 Tax=Gloeophyllum trabeum (strain ATCC 11539 / FP-39264 / Madison 617) TaxID=670483 RepID=S7QN90_GLOTA|nr:Rhodanese-like protein [Gloeophyllum trabeum ATCC 11539]EPQ60922.1 Rhodanese-like protein [Gloeophyllum trabeum ATCC 11539]
MLRLAATRCVGCIARTNATQARVRLTITQSVRYKSDDPLKAVRETRDKLQKDWDAPVLTYEQVKAKSQQPSPNSYLIDVREPDEVVQGSIPSAVNLPLSTIAADLNLDAAAFKEKYGFEKPKKDQELIFYCRSGKRSASAADVAKRNGFTNIFNYSGSWLDWIAREGVKGAS